MKTTLAYDSVRLGWGEVVDFGRGAHIVAHEGGRTFLISLADGNIWASDTCVRFKPRYSLDDLGVTEEWYNYSKPEIYIYTNLSEYIDDITP